MRTLRWLVHVSGTACRLSCERWTVVLVLLCRDSKHFFSAVSASEDFLDFALYKCSHYITLHYKNGCVAVPSPLSSHSGRSRQAQRVETWQTDRQTHNRPRALPCRYKSSIKKRLHAVPACLRSCRLNGRRLLSRAYESSIVGWHVVRLSDNWRATVVDYALGDRRRRFVMISYRACLRHLTSVRFRMRIAWPPRSRADAVYCGPIISCATLMSVCLISCVRVDLLRCGHLAVSVM